MSSLLTEAERSAHGQSQQAAQQRSPQLPQPPVEPGQPPLPTPEQTQDQGGGQELQAQAQVSPAPPVSTTPPAPRVISDSVEINEDEFESDPEVRYCLLSPAEVDIKERIWVHDNKDYLRAQQAKAIKRALLEEEAAANGGLRPKRRTKRRKARRMGDVGYLHEGADGEDADGEGGPGTLTRASTPAEATRRMLEKRGFSKKINYKLFEGLYDTDEGSVNGDADASARTSRAGSVVPQVGIATGVAAGADQTRRQPPSIATAPVPAAPTIKRSPPT
ncbi:transcription factor TFIIIB subunit brf1, partial [Ascosphaera acerosa]